MANYRVPVLEDFSWQPPVEDKELVTSPSGGGVLKGMRYIVATNGGDWSGGAAKDIATCVTTDPQSGEDWMFDTPDEGWFAYVKDEHATYRFNESSAWVKDDLAAAVLDISSNSEAISNTNSSVGSIDTRVSGNESTNVTQSTAIVNTDSSVGSIDTVVGGHTTDISNTNSSVGSIDTHVTSCDSSIVSINTRTSNTESSVGSIDTVAGGNVTDISNTNSSVGSIDTHVDSCDSSIVSINTRTSNLESSVGSINSAEQDKGTYVSAYGAIEFTI